MRVSSRNNSRATCCFPDDPQAVVATGFMAAGPWDQSSQMGIMDGTVDKQVRAYLDRDDMLTTTMSTFVSTTVHCARCHNHKFDPIPQRGLLRAAGGVRGGGSDRSALRSGSEGAVTNARGS